jgi:hypothetical protein
MSTVSLAGSLWTPFSAPFQTGKTKNKHVESMTKVNHNFLHQVRFKAKSRQWFGN